MTTFIIKKVCAFGAAVAVACATWGMLSRQAASAGEISAIPSPMAQGGMIMPTFSIINADNFGNPTTGQLSVSFSPSVLQMQSLEQWSPGSWFATGATWRADLGSPAGVGGTPAANAGAGDLFSSRYGFQFTADGTTTAFVPAGKSLGIRLTSVSSPLLESYNYDAGLNLWDPIFTATSPTSGSQVLWDGTMWHNLFVLPAAAPGGTYTADFEVFVANTAFTSTTTGKAQYDAAALTATADASFTPASATYTWDVAAVPEPSTLAMLATVAAGAGFAGCRRFRRRQEG
ncbi:MAG: PEP-CTERM sorting domain-containing protein [Pirellulales bacterium]|nr:PEP-CTERM sorting domain-containing protein [Pirellulales bacterium]